MRTAVTATAIRRGRWRSRRDELEREKLLMSTGVIGSHLHLRLLERVRIAVRRWSGGNLRRWWCGWTAVVISMALSCFWAMWGAIENFHEGWYYREWSRNVGLALAQYLPWMFVPMVAALVGLSRPAAGLAVHLALAVGAVTLFGLDSFGTRFVALPIVLLGILYFYGRPSPVRWARLALVVLPLLTAVVSGAYPAWRVFTRPTLVDGDALHLRRPDLDITWAQVGPGWGHGVSWDDASRRCGHLEPEGAELSATPEGVWRLPTADEAVRSMTYRGHDAEGRWDQRTATASFRVQPDKEAPLWNPFSHVIYLWTSTERDSRFAYFVTYNGGVYARRKDWHPAYQGYRCVRVRESAADLR
jgi:hypothetical protein